MKHRSNSGLCRLEVHAHRPWLEGDGRPMVLNAAIYQREVADVCLNCDKPSCNAGTNGCEAFKAARKQLTRDSGMSRRRSQRKEDGHGGLRGKE